MGFLIEILFNQSKRRRKSHGVLDRDWVSLRAWPSSPGWKWKGGLGDESENVKSQKMTSGASQGEQCRVWGPDRVDDLHDDGN